MNNANFNNNDPNLGFYQPFQPGPFYGGNNANGQAPLYMSSQVDEDLGNLYGSSPQVSGFQPRFESDPSGRLFDFAQQQPGAGGATSSPASQPFSNNFSVPGPAVHDASSGIKPPDQPLDYHPYPQQWDTQGAKAEEEMPPPYLPPLSGPPPVFPVKTDQDAGKNMYLGASEGPSKMRMCLNGSEESAVQDTPFKSADASANNASTSSRGEECDVDIRHTDRGIESDDAQLNDRDVALSFFEKYNTPPGLYINANGYHTEHHTHWRMVGKVMMPVTETRIVTDFDYNFDLSRYVSRKGKFDQRSSVGLYLASSNLMRRCRMTKKVAFNFNAIRNAIVKQIRHIGYSDSISVIFSYSDDEVLVESSDKCARCLRNNYTTCLCWLTCACIIWYPIKWFMQGRSDGDQDFESVFRLDATTDEIIELIRPNCRGKGAYFTKKL